MCIPDRSSWWDHQVNPSCHLPFPLPCLPLAISYRRHTTIQWSEHEEFVSGIPPSAGGSLPPFSLISLAPLNMQWTPSATFSNTSKSRHYLYSNSIISTGMVQYFLYHLLNINVFAVLSLPLGLTRNLSNLPVLLWIGICRS